MRTGSNCNNRRMTRGQTTCTCGLGGAASLELLYHIYSYNSYCRFPENEFSFDGLLTLRVKGQPRSQGLSSLAP